MSTNPTLQQQHAALCALVEDAARRHNVPGVAVCVLLDGAEDYVCHGVTSVTDPLPVDEATFFQIGSTTKTYTATAIMVLVERGLVELDAPVRRYLPQLRLADEQVATNVTILQLLNHTAGWSGDFFKDTGPGDEALARFVDRLAEARQELPLGAYVSYNNAAVCLAGRVIEVVTGQTYEAALQTLVLDPLGLREHFFFPWDVMTRRFAMGHALRDEQLEVAPWHMPRSGHPAGANFASTVRDQLRYARFHLGTGDGILRPGTLARMRTPTTPHAGKPGVEAYGIGWQLRDVDGARVVSHGGTTLGHETAFETVREHGFALTVLTNASHGGPLSDEVKQWAFETYLGLAERIPEPLALPAVALAEYAGTYASAIGTLKLAVDGDRLHGAVTLDPQLLAELFGPDATPQTRPP